MLQKKNTWKSTVYVLFGGALMRLNIALLSWKPDDPSLHTLKEEGHSFIFDVQYVFLPYMTVTWEALKCRIHGKWVWMDITRAQLNNLWRDNGMHTSIKVAVTKQRMKNVVWIKVLYFRKNHPLHPRVMHHRLHLQAVLDPDIALLTLLCSYTVRDGGVGGLLSQAIQRSPKYYKDHNPNQFS